jgi:hypothetical protein
MIKSINQAMNPSIHLASTIVSVSVFVVADDAGKVVSVLGGSLLLSNNSNNS